MITFKDYLTEQSPRHTASVETENLPREKRIQMAQKSDAMLRKEKEAEIKKLKTSKDPIDREISNLRARLATLMQRKKQQAK